MKVAITGAEGLFGHGLAQVFRERHGVVALTRAEADITDAARVRAALDRCRPDVVIHAAAIPDLDVCEENPAWAELVNVEGTRNVVEAARSAGAGVAYISTDAVFDGRKNSPYLETDAVNPPTVYGRTKAAAERVVMGLPRHWILRVSVLFGPGKTNFVEKGLRKLAAGEKYIVAADQTGSATYTLDAARTIEQFMAAGAFGLFHLSNEGTCTRYELARRAAEFAGFDPGLVIGKPMAEMPRPAQRLRYSVMAMEGLRRVGITPPRPWQAALEDYLFSLGFGKRPREEQEEAS